MFSTPWASNLSHWCTLQDERACALVVQHAYVLDDWLDTATLVETFLAAQSDAQMCM